MKDNIPDFVEKALNEWEAICFFAYDNFESNGRGVIAFVEEQDDVNVMYAPRDYFLQKKDDKVLELIDTYNPSREFLISFETPDGIRTLRIGTPENGRHPKRVWFFEMLRIASEEPDELPDKLPEWFIQACDKLEDIKK